MPHVLAGALTTRIVVLAAIASFPLIGLPDFRASFTPPRTPFAAMKPRAAVTCNN
jgi:hypothetical protein